MNPEKHAYSRLHIWWLAIRPKTLPAALSAVIVACALTAHDGVEVRARDSAQKRNGYMEKTLPAVASVEQG